MDSGRSLSPPLCLLTLLVIHIIHVHATANLVFMVGIFGTGITIHRKARSGGRLSWFLFCLWMSRMRQFDDAFRLQVVGMELTDNGLFQPDGLPTPRHSALVDACSKLPIENTVDVERGELRIVS